MSNENEPADETPKVGRGHPPKHSQFRKGVSGFPSGRPKGSKNLSTILREAARDQVTATIGGKTRKISKIQATAMQLATKAAGGDAKSMNTFLNWIDEFDKRKAAERPSEFPIGEADIAVIRETHARMKQCEAQDAID